MRGHIAFLVVARLAVPQHRFDVKRIVKNRFSLALGYKLIVPAVFLTRVAAYSIFRPLSVKWTCAIKSVSFINRFERLGVG